MGDPEKDELDEMLNDDVGDDDMVEKPTSPAKPTPAEIRAAVEPILAETQKTVLVALQLSDDEKSLLDQLLAVYRSDAVMNKMASSGKTLKEITEALKKEMDDVTAHVRAYKKLAVAPPAPPPPPPPPPPVAPSAPFRPKGGSMFFEVEDKMAASAAASPACVVCGQSGTLVPLLFMEGKYYCIEHSKDAGVAATATIIAKPPPAKPWHIHKLQPFDAIRKRVDGGLSLIQAQAAEGGDEVQMKPSDRIVVTLIKADGSRHKVFDKVVGAALLYLFKFDLSSWGQSSLSPHMASQRGLTPPGYG